MTDTCPHCQANLQGDEIPDESRHYYGTATHFGRVIGWDGGRPGIYDGVIAWACPDCNGWWHRFPEHDPIRARVERYMSERDKP